MLALIIVALSLMAPAHAQINEIPAACSKFNDFYPSSFCQGLWKTYKLKEAVSLSSNVINTYMNGKDYQILNETIYLTNTNSDYSTMTSKVSVAKIGLRSSVITEIFTASFSFKYINIVSHIALDRNGFIYVFVQNDKTYQLFKLDANSPHKQVSAAIFQTSSYDQYNNFFYDQFIDKLYAASSNNMLIVNTQTLAVEFNDTFVAPYRQFLSSGNFLYNTDGFSLVKYDVRNMESHLKTVNSNLPFDEFSFFGFTLVNQCVFVNVISETDDFLSYNATIKLMYVDGEQGLSISTADVSSGQYEMVSAFDGKVYAIDWQKARVLVVDYDRS